jgi:hypothetical protein
MRKLATILLLPAVALLATTGSADAQATAGAASLLIAPGARAEGMGRSFVAISDDATASWWNPAGMAFINGKVVSAMHTQLVPDLANDVYYEYLGYHQHLEGWGGIGATFIFLSYGKSIETRPDSPDPVGEFSSYEFAPSVAIGTQIAEGLGVGVNLKVVHVNLAPASVGSDGKAGAGTTFAADFGALYKMKNLPINLGASFQNLGPDIALVDEKQSDPLGRNLKVGIAYQVVSNDTYSALATFDFNKPFVFLDDEPIYNGGAEFIYGRLIALRAGYIYDDAGTIKNPTYGVGVTYKGWSFDYASVPQSVFLESRVSKFSLTARF